MSKDTPLALQIQAAELHVRIRKQLIACRTAQISTQFRKKLTAPSTLLAAALTGFLLQRVMRPLPWFARKSKSGASSLGLFARIAEIIAVARALLTSWPGALVRRFAGGSEPASPSQPLHRL